MADVRAILSTPSGPAHYRPRWADWHASNGPEYCPDDTPLPTPPDVMPPPAMALDVAPSAFEPPVAGDWGTWNEPRPGALDWHQVDQIRRGRAAGRTLRELADLVERSVATVKRALRSDYRPAGKPPAPEPPPAAIAEAEDSSAIRWDPADDA
jgi:hypothetical protein